MTSKDWVSAEKQDKNSDQIEELEKVPPLRFPEFSGNWNGIKLKRIFTNKTSNLSINNLLENKGEYKLYGATGLIKCIDFYEINVPYVAIVKDGAGVGRITLCDENSSILGTMQALIAKEDFDLKFSYYSLNKINFNKYVIGSTIPHIYFKDYSKETVFVPSINEQKKISAFITLVDKKIELMEKKYTTLQKYKNGLMQKIFENKIGFSLNDWIVKKLNEITFFQEGPGVRNYQYTKEGVRLLNVGNFVKNEIKFNTDRHISEEEAYGKYKHFLVDEGDLLIACSGIKAEYFNEKIAFAKSKHLPLCMNTSTMRFKSLNTNFLSLYYLKYFLQTEIFKKQVFKVLTGSAQFNFGPTHIKYFRIPIPPLEEQEKIADFLSEIDNKIDSVEQQLEKIKEFKKYLLQQMFV